MKARFHSRRGIAILEMLIYATLLALVAAFGMALAGQGRILRSMADNRAELLMVAQSELDRLRAIPTDAVEFGETERTDASWPGGTLARATVTDRGDGTALVDVTVTRELAEGLAPVRLLTIRRTAP